MVCHVRGKHTVPGTTPTLVGGRRDGSLIFDPGRDGTAASGWLENSRYTSDRSARTRKWPYPAFVEVYLQCPDDPPAPTASPIAVASMPPYAVLDPRASTPPKTWCFSDTTPWADCPVCPFGTFLKGALVRPCAQKGPFMQKGGGAWTTVGTTPTR